MTVLPIGDDTSIPLTQRKNLSLQHCHAKKDTCLVSARRPTLQFTSRSQDLQTVDFFLQLIYKHVATRWKASEYCGRNVAANRCLTDSILHVLYHPCELTLSVQELAALIDLGLRHLLQSLTNQEEGLHATLRIGEALPHVPSHGRHSRILQLLFCLLILVCDCTLIVCYWKKTEELSS